MKETISIDGSYGEGGGQILRTACALSVITAKPVRIFNIRANRPNPGLRTQHIKVIESLAHISCGRYEGVKLGSKEVWFFPGEGIRDKVKVKIETAGSAGLVLESLLIAAMRCRKRISLEIDGGATFGAFAPPLPYIQYVILPILRKMGYHAEINIIRHGFYPAGGAKVKATIIPPKALAPVSFENPFSAKLVNILSVASKHLKKAKVAERQARSAEKLLNEYGCGVEIKTMYADSISVGSGIVLSSKTFSGSVVGSDSLGEKGKLAEEVGYEAAQGLLACLDKATLDIHAADQILPFISFAKGTSIFTTPELSMHAKTNIWVIERFLGKLFAIKHKNNVFVVECKP